MVERLPLHRRIPGADDDRIPTEGKKETQRSQQIGRVIRMAICCDVVRPDAICYEVVDLLRSVANAPMCYEITVIAREIKNCHIAGISLPHIANVTPGLDVRARVSRRLL